MRAVFLASAEQDLEDLRRYVLKSFGKPAWQETRHRIGDAVRLIQHLPQSGTVPVELARMGYQQYRQVSAGLNCLVYEIRNEVVLISIVCDGRRDMRTLLSRRLVRIGSVNDPRFAYQRLAAVSVAAGSGSSP